METIQPLRQGAHCSTRLPTCHDAGRNPASSVAPLLDPPARLGIHRIVPESNLMAVDSSANPIDKKSEKEIRDYLSPQYRDCDTAHAVHERERAFFFALVSKTTPPCAG
jgi:hypothetical protein